jgi:hypothetical protein
MRRKGWSVVALLFLVASCKKTVEGENKNWQRNVARVTQLQALYPGFANALKEQQKRAEDAMAAARAVSDPQQSAKKMADANALIDSGFVYTLSQIDAHVKSLREKLVTANTQAEHASDQAGAKAATDDAQRILKNVDDALKAGAPTADAAAAVVQKIDSDISSAASNLDRVIAAAQQRKAEAAKATAAATAAPAGAAAVAKVQWKCTYCGHMNDDARQKCENCGAPRPTAKAAPPAAGKKKK